MDVSDYVPMVVRVIGICGAEVHKYNENDHTQLAPHLRVARLLENLGEDRSGNALAVYGPRLTIIFQSPQYVN